MSISLTLAEQKKLQLVRMLMDDEESPYSTEDALTVAKVPTEMRERLRAKIEEEQNQEVRVVHAIRDQDVQHIEWLQHEDRTGWFYWPRLRHYLLHKKDWEQATVRSVDGATDKILSFMEDPAGDRPFFTKGLVVGYVQSGKTANYTSLIAKAADAGYRLVIVLTGIHNSLRLQTQRRLDKELVGESLRRAAGVGIPDEQHLRWITFTDASLGGDFNPGLAGTAMIGHHQPTLLVIKKNARVLERLNEWLGQLSQNLKGTLPVLVIDDEADQASINTGGNRPVADRDSAEEPEDDGADENAPSVINGLIRKLLTYFRRVAYVAYTATPYANVLIDHRAVDREARDDLYPHSFIISLPPPNGYWGAEELFGNEEGRPGLNLIRPVSEADEAALVPRRRDDAPTFDPPITASLEDALRDFVLAGAARLQRGQEHKPATMLIHTSYLTAVQQRLTAKVEEWLADIKDDWRYDAVRRDELSTWFRGRWEIEFRPLSRTVPDTPDVAYGDIHAWIGPFLEQLEVRQVNSATEDEDELDYERDPELKVIVVGGNRLSRGLTLEGLTVSYYVRSSRTYDTLMQMGRWFGYRDGYVDLTRIYMTDDLRDMFRDLATIESELREEIARYDREDLTPLEFGVKIRRHPSMMITSELKMGDVQRVQVSYAGQLEQTTSFRLSDKPWLSDNLSAATNLIASLGAPTGGKHAGNPVWENVPVAKVLTFLSEYKVDDLGSRMRPEKIREYIEAQWRQNELTSWTVAVMGQTQVRPDLGAWTTGNLACPEVPMIERTRLRDSDTSVKAIVSPGDEAVGLSEAQKVEANQLKDAKGARSVGRFLRQVRPATQGVLLLYPISPESGHRFRSESDANGVREALYRTPQDKSLPIIGIALSFPDSKSAASVEYVVGSVGVG